MEKNNGGKEKQLSIVVNLLVASWKHVGNVQLSRLSLSKALPPSGPACHQGYLLLTHYLKYQIHVIVNSLEIRQKGKTFIYVTHCQ